MNEKHKKIIKLLITTFFIVLLISQTALLINAVYERTSSGTIYVNIKPKNKITGKFYNFKLFPMVWGMYKDSVSIGKSFDKTNMRIKILKENNSNISFSIIPNKQAVNIAFHNFRSFITKNNINISYTANIKYFSLNNKISKIKVEESFKRSDAANYLLLYNRKTFIKKITNDMLVISVNNLFKQIYKNFKGYYDVKVNMKTLGKINTYCATKSMLSKNKWDNPNVNGIPRAKIIRNGNFNFIHWFHYKREINGEMINLVIRKGLYAVIVKILNSHFSYGNKNISVSYSILVKTFNEKYGYTNNYLQIHAFIKKPKIKINKFYKNKIKTWLFKKSFTKIIKNINNQYIGTCK